MTNRVSVIDLAEELRERAETLHRAVRHLINNRLAYTYTDAELAELEEVSKQRNGLTHGRVALLIDELRMLRAEKAERLATTKEPRE